MKYYKQLFFYREVALFFCTHPVISFEQLFQKGLKLTTGMKTN